MTIEKPQDTAAPMSAASALSAGLERLFEDWAGTPPVEFTDMDKDPMGFWCWKAWQKATEIERDACAQLCHDAFMYLEHGTDRSDPQDDREAHILALVARDLRDDIKKRSNA